MQQMVVESMRKLQRKLQGSSSMWEDSISSVVLDTLKERTPKNIYRKIAAHATCQPVRKLDSSSGDWLVDTHQKVGTSLSVNKFGHATIFSAFIPKICSFSHFSFNKSAPWCQQGMLLILFHASGLAACGRANFKFEKWIYECQNNNGSLPPVYST